MADHKHKTKNSNTFRFKTFADRVNEIDLRRLALYHIGHENEDLPEDNETYFHQTLKKWMALNLSEEYSQFSKKLVKVVTLAQLLHQKDFVVDLLLDKLACATNLSLQPLLELLYVLARDLREEFYPYFQRVLDRLICLLNTQDADQLEWVSVCLAYLFKELKPYLKRNIGVVFNCILPLLDERRYEEHVTNFAVECFSFVARDVRDYGKLLEFILKTIAREQVESVQGCGRLLFEIMRGVKGKFHSIAEEFLDFLFKSVVNDKQQNSQLLNDIVEYCILQLLQFINPQEMPLFWRQLCQVSNNCQNAAKLQNLCCIFLQIVEFKQCRYLAEMDAIVPSLLLLMDKSMNDPSAVETLKTCTKIISCILLSGSSLVTQLDSSCLLKKCLSIKDRQIYAEFVKQMTCYVQFEIFILPSLIKHFEEYFDKPALELLTLVIMKKKPLLFNAMNHSDTEDLEIKVKSKDTLTKVEESLKYFDTKSFQLEEQVMLLIIAPHLKGLQKDNLHKPLNQLLKTLINLLQAGNPEEKQLNLLCLVVSTYIQLKFILSKEIVTSLTDILLKNIEHLRVLGALNQLISNYPVSEKNQQQLHSAVSKFLSHHDHEKRLLASHSLYQMFKEQNHYTPYHILYQAELIEPNVHNYREQVLLIQKLETQGELFKRFSEDYYKEDCMRFLLGLLYHNFKFIWEPVLKLLEDYAKHIDTSKFWLIYQEKLQSTQEKIDYFLKNNNAIPQTSHWHSSALNDVLPQQIELDLGQQQLINYRNLLWQRLPQFGKLVELKNRELVGLFLKFVEEEYKQKLENKEISWNLSLQCQNSADIDDMEEDNEEQQEINIKKPNIKKKSRYNTTVDTANAKSILQTLQTKLLVFAAHQNPRALYREPELWSLYVDLLKSANQELQKSALDCIFSYKSKALMPYKENLYNILDEKKLKDELINFKVETVSSEHRQEFMEILLRLLYGKMITRGTQKGISPQQRKSIILRFLAQCSLTEIEWFLQMAFGLYNDFCRESVDILTIPSLVKEKFNMQCVWSPKKLQSVVNLLELIRKEFGGLMEKSFHYYMLKLLFFVGSICNEVLLLDNSLIHTKMPLVFKNLKQNALQSVYRFFEHIEEFEWTPDLIKCLSTVFVFPTLGKLPSDSIHSPTYLLKLLLLWGEKPKHFMFLDQKLPDKQENIFKFIILLLLNEKSKALVRKPIMALIERLLVASENNLEYANQGLQLVIPHIPDLLQRLKMNFSTKGAKQQLDKRDLNVLSMLTKHVTEPETCDSLLQLLLPILIARTQSQSSNEVVTQVITTLSNLIKRLETPESYIRKIAPLYEQVQEVVARKQLCDLIADIARIKHKQNPNSADSQQLNNLARIIFLLNAWDKRWVEQPDYEKRLDAFKEIKLQTETAQGVHLDLGILVIYNCFYFLRHDKDMGLRDNASEILKILLPHLAKKYAADKVNIDYFVGDVFINLIRRVIKDSHENVRNEGIRLLGEMARECPETHEVLKDLHGLGDKMDVEVDFFENMIHLQSHRHGRALLKFNAFASSLDKPPCVRTLTQFILPLASRYLLQEQHASKHTLIDAAIETVGVVCQLLPWQHYHSILRYYLMKMRLTHDYQKQCVRIVVRILDGFHYDLSLAQNDQQTMETLKTVIKEKAEELHTEIQECKQEVQDMVEKKILEDGGDEEVDDSNSSKPENDENETLEQALEKAEDKEQVDEEEHVQNIIKSEPCLHRITILPGNASKKVLTAITTILIPTLNRSITEKSSYDNKHKVNRKRLSIEREEEEILRVPIGLALVKLMQKLPKELMDSSLPGVFMKVCTFLRSPLKSVRMLTRDILKKIMMCLGSKYLPMLMDHLQNLLTRGFQVHVLSVTIHGVLDALRDSLEPSDIESCLHNLLEVALNDIFGEISAEKEVDKLTAHTPEAKPSAKSFIVLHIIARNIRETCLLDLLMPFKDYLAKSKSRKITLKIQDSFEKIVNGLVENSHISPESLLIFIYGTMSESITDLLPGTQRRVLSEQEKEKMRRARPDCFIIQPAPRMRTGAINCKVKTNSQANAHILIEFGLEMLHVVLKRKKLVDVNYPPFLNPILPLLKDSLKSTHIRVTTFALKCYATLWVEVYKLTEMEQPQYIKDVVERMFEILKNFSTFGATKQEDNFQLIKSVFKAIVALLRKCEYYNLTEEQIDELVLYIEQNLHEGEAMTFNLLKAMLTRKVDSKAMHDVMKRIGDISITSYSDYVRDEARNLLTIYVMEYHLHKKVDQIVKFFTVQLCYSLPAGRLSAIEFLLTIIKKFPLSILVKKSEFLYLSLGSRLVNDVESECRKAVANCIEVMITRLEKKDRQHLFDMTLLFFNVNNKPSVREMGAALCSRFLNAEKQSFAPRIKLILPIVVGRITINATKPGRFVRAPNAVQPTEELETSRLKSKKFKKGPKNLDIVMEHEVNNVLQGNQEEDTVHKQRSLDHELIQMQYCMLKIFDYNSAEIFNNDELSSTIDELAYESQRLLAHEHNWVRCNAAKILSQIISSIDFPLIGRKLSQIHKEEDDKKRINMDFIYLNPEYDIKSLVLDLCAQLIPGETAQPMIDEIVKIFLYIATMLRDVPFKEKREFKDKVETEEDHKESLTKINLNWLMKNIRFLINKEVSKASHCTNMRTALFTLIEALITLLSVETLEHLGPSLLSALVREMSEADQNIDAELRQLALRVGSRLRKRIGSDVYDKLRTAAQMKLLVRRAERKKLIAQEKIHDPVRAAKRKVAVQERKKSAKKLKASVIRGKTADVKQKFKRMKRKAEDDFF